MYRVAKINLWKVYLIGLKEIKHLRNIKEAGQNEFQVHVISEIFSIELIPGINISLSLLVWLIQSPQH